MLLAEGNAGHALRSGAALAQRFAEGGVLLAPVVDADDLRPGIALAHGDCRRAASAAQCGEQEGNTILLDIRFL